jgi:hypothetical protein
MKGLLRHLNLAQGAVVFLGTGCSSFVAHTNMAEPKNRLAGTTIAVPFAYGSIAFWLGRKADEFHTHRWSSKLILVLVLVLLVLLVVLLVLLLVLLVLLLMLAARAARLWAVRSTTQRIIQHVVAQQLLNNGALHPDGSFCQVYQWRGFVFLCQESCVSSAPQFHQPSSRLVCFA